MIILTGGAGFIGSAFLSRLNSEGIDDVLVVDDLGSTQKWKNLRRLKFADYLHKDEFFYLIDNELFEDHVDAVVHLGACSSTTEQDAEYLMRNNYRFTKTLACWAIERDARFIYASSAATYGDGRHGFSDSISLLPQLTPLNGYAFSKHQFDLWAETHGAFDSIVGLKFFNVFGPNEYHKGEMTSVVYKAYRQITESGSVRLFKSYRSEYRDGEQRRDFIYVKDCSDVIWWLLQTPRVVGLYNLGTGKSRTWLDLGKSVFAALGRESNIEFTEMPATLRDKYQYFTEAEMGRLREAGYLAPFTALEDAVGDYVRNYLQREDPHL
jgi:ADP-L-glycero-D-manno-heptose 6-epimerase